MVVKSLEVLNLTGTLLEIENDENILENLFLEYIENLTVLEIGENRIKSWNNTILNSNWNLKSLKLSDNGRDIILSDAMITDMFHHTKLGKIKQVLKYLGLRKL